VKLGRSKLTQDQYAIKFLPLSKETSSIEEIKILKKIDHPNIIKCIETFEDEKFIYVVMEYCSGGELLAQSSDPFSENYTCEIIFKLLHAVNHMHSLGICHRDIKPENCLLDSEGDLRLIDFGLSSNYFPAQKMTKIVGTPYYMAPEVLTGEYGPECDLWSIGVIMHVMLLGRLPFSGETQLKILQKVKNGKFLTNSKEFQNLSSDARQLLKGLLIKDPGKRLNCAEAISCSWFDAIRQNNLVPNNILNSLNNIQEISYFKLHILASCIPLLPLSELYQYKKYFSNLDTLKNGAINLIVDENKTHKISYTKFLILTLKEKIKTECLPTVYNWCKIVNYIQDTIFSTEALRNFSIKRGYYVPTNFIEEEFETFAEFVEYFNN
jgi:calcium-dependent protein kinase